MCSNSVFYECVLLCRFVPQALPCEMETNEGEIDSKTEDTTEQESGLKSHPDIDGGWGWMIVLASFVSHVLIMGSHMALGILYVEWLEEFKESRGLTAWVGSLTIGITLIVGPVIGLFVSTCGCRKTTIIGGVVTALGWMLSAYASNIYFLFISFGLTAGVGSGMAYLPAVVMVGRYFQRRRALAQGLSTTGTGFGTFIMTLLLKHLCMEYGWRNAMLIHGAVNLNLCVCGALMRPPPSGSGQRKAPDSLEPQGQRQRGVQHEPDSCSVRLDWSEEQGTSQEGESKSLSPEDAGVQQQEPENKDRGPVKIIFKEKYPLRMVKTLSQMTNSMKMGFWKWHSSYIGDGSLFSNKVFICFVLWAMFAYCSFVIPFIHLPEIVKLYGFDDENNKIPLTSIIAILHIFGKIFLGLVSDLPYVSAWNVFFIANLAMCVCVFVLPLMHTFAGLAIVCAMMGFSSGYFSVMPVVTEDLVGLNNLANAYGVIICANGISALLGPPVAGWIYDVSETYDYSFYLSGVLYMVGISFLMLKPCLQKTSTTEERKQGTKASCSS
ncbi:MOT14 protein, partial [Atractosteus spatula]|nr:MOT14 protein [Atractosteus spatula]